MKNEALLVMDVQNGIVANHSNGDDSVLAPFQKAIKAARHADMPVIYVRVAFRDGYPEVSGSNKMFSAIAASGNGFTQDSEATQVHEAVAPESDDVVVIKRRVSAFAGSDLEEVLRARNIDKLVLTGIATSGVVLSTLRQAADRDYGLTVLSDACLDGDEDVQRVLTEKVFPRQAEVLTVDEWVRKAE